MFLHFVFHHQHPLSSDKLNVAAALPCDHAFGAIFSALFLLMIGRNGKCEAWGHFGGFHLTYEIN